VVGADSIASVLFTGRSGFSVGVIALAAATACGPAGAFLRPSGPRETQGTVIDDGGDLPSGRNAPLAGVRVEALDGPKAGTFVVTDGTGTYRLPPLGASPVTLKATKDGYDPETQLFYSEYSVGPYFRLGAPPHTLWGDVVLARTTPSELVPHVQLEILDGPNAGKVAIGDESARYRFDDLVASPRYSLRLSKAGYQTRTYSMIELRHNQQHNVQIDR
jgi:hypothetical protein